MPILFAILSVMIGLAVPAAAHADDLDTILKERGDTLNARNASRHPKEVMTLFEVGEGQTVIDVLPGRWYGSIIAPLIGAEGTYIGARYSIAHYEATRKNFTGERREREVTFADRWPGMVDGFALNPPKQAFFRTGEAPETLYGTVDRYLFIRALHHLSKTDEIFSVAEEAFKLVKEGGIVGIVQHRAKEDRDDEWAKGWNGYVKQSRIVEAFTRAGFVLEEASEINANPKDLADKGDVVWRLPPAGGDTEETKAIGESDRMTLKFRKPR